MCRHRDSFHSDDSLVYYDSDHNFSDSDSTYSDEELSQQRAEEQARRAQEKQERKSLQMKINLSTIIIVSMVSIWILWSGWVSGRNFYRDLTFNNTFNINTWQWEKSVQSQQTRLELETIQQASKIALALEIFKLMPIDQQLQFNKWVPVPSGFMGVDDYLRSINKFQTATHQFMYFAEPKFKINGTATELMFEWGNFKHRQTFVKGRSDCDNCPKAEWNCKDGILTIKEDTLFAHRKFTRVYYIPINDLLKLLPSN